MNLLPHGYSVPEERVKPLGTAQAILAAKDLVSDKFIIINADDYYGSDSFKVAANYLNNLKPGAKNAYANVAYMVKNTMTENGSVKRGVLVFVKENKLQHLVESTIEHKDGKIVATPLDTTDSKFIPEDTLVSMNMFCFTKDIMDYIQDNFAPFMDANKDNLMKCEYLIPTLVSDLVYSNTVSVSVLPTTSVWYGITYLQDKPSVVASLAKLMDEGEYPFGLWNN